MTFLDAINACNERAWEADHMLVTFDYRNPGSHQADRAGDQSGETIWG